MPTIVTPLIILLPVAVSAYLLGSVPFGLVVAKIFSLPDPRTIGSGNIGATNVLRTGSKFAALLTVLLDGAKGAVAVLVARFIAGEDAAQVAALAAFIGHLFPVWLGFKGGKGVATLLGTLVALLPVLGLIALISWLFGYFVFRYSSLSALLAAAVTPLVAYAQGHTSYLVLLILMAALVWWRHRANISRLLNGTEPTVDWRNK
ncbi:MAG: glycerol-3-phosphate 1-O-acyltransferase PlsY [Boseongicola sp.]